MEKNTDTTARSEEAGKEVRGLKGYSTLGKSYLQLLLAGKPMLKNEEKSG